mgnify:CR=1 FL=1
MVMLYHAAILLSLLGTTLPSMDDVHRYLQRGHDVDAMAVLEERIKQDPKDLESLLALALLEMENSNYAQAAGYLEKILALDPYDDDSRVELAEAYWRISEKQKAQDQLAELLNRHPEWPRALELKAVFDKDETLPGPPLLWSPLVRGDLSFGFDSNPRLDNTLTSTLLGRLESRDSSFTSAVSVAAGIQHLGRTRPFTLVAHIHTQQSVGDFNRFKEMMPTALGLRAAGRLYVGPVLSELHVHYEELFTNLFSKHYHRQVRTTASGQYKLNRSNTLQVSIGADIRKITEQTADVTARASIRDSLTMGRFSLSLDAKLRYNAGQTDNLDPATLEVGFLETSGVIYTEYRFKEPFTLFTMLDFSVRDVPDILEEATFFTKTGIIWNLSFCDLHSEYTYTRNRSNEEQRNYNRHQFTTGVRFWYD